MKNKDFIDWFSYNFGYGYGVGEQYIIPALTKFIKTVPDSGNYDYRKLEEVVGKSETWFLMNILCGEDLIEYGTSPRFGWLNKKGQLLKEFLANKTDDELYEMVMVDPDYIYCSPNYCNCGEKGYEEGKKCENPLF